MATGRNHGSPAVRTMNWRSIFYYLEATLLLSVISAHVFLAPFTKVEESFNVQATYDLLYKRWSSIHSFDHITFPGVVPRTFVMPVLFSLLTSIPKALIRLNPHATIHAFRLTLGAIVAASLLSIRNAIASHFSDATATIFTLFTVAQFHVPFYASRPLPNVFALALTNLALARRLCAPSCSNAYASVALLSLAVALLRSELVLYLFPTIISAAVVDTHIEGKLMMFVRLCACAFLTAVATALVSIVVDSYFWSRWAYPELEVFYFNAVLGKSSAWGTLPWHWYFTNALPRAVGAVIILAGLGAVVGYRDSEWRRKVRVVGLPAVAFVAVYSMLPHKELRFVLYVIPVLNVVAAAVVGDAIRALQVEIRARAGREPMTAVEGVKGHTKAESRRRMVQMLLRYGGLLIVALASIAASTLQTVISTGASMYNYPSAYALRRLHLSEGALLDSLALRGDDGLAVKRDVWVHIDVDSAMNGITQFVYDDGAAVRHATGEDKVSDKGWTWRYSKTEGLNDSTLREFSYAVSERRQLRGFCVVLVQKAFVGVDWRRRNLRLAEHTFVHRNMNLSTKGCLPREEQPLHP